MTPELIVALDLPSLADLPPLLKKLPDQVRYFKIGLELFTAEGPAAVRLLRERRKEVFLDLKLHDIPNTVARTVTAAARLEVALLTVHAAGGRAMLEAAVEAARACAPRAPKLIAVTTLTSLNQQDLMDIGIQRDLSAQALALGELALAAGVSGLVTSVHEAGDLRKRFGPTPLLVTPGIRPGGEAQGDQKRVATPAMAVKAGASFLVVGRPIVAAVDPSVAAQAILDEMAAATR